ncbi:dentin matrix acidic phosphoprotein 1 isoform X2 [Phlebotomus papatasi]|uniref:dentin matrix acidic phosphoprotein 1 isoform X2 n=1 Tax=Phlebotomus papatasi TaxID=29031 RepID=UPI0024839025|nr:dentin matrix acidic phosphoprotein 1 isoform X2 [Phlebotomus papatasi]
MKQLVVLVSVLVVVAALPVPSEEQPKTSLDLLQIPLQNGKELDILSLADENGKLSERNKRTIDILRQLFPTISQIIEQKIQMILPILIRTVGPILLRGGLGGSSGGGGQTSNDDDDDIDSNGGSNDRKVSVSLPVFEPGSDDDDEDDDFVDNSASPTSVSSTVEPEKTISLRTRIDGVETGGDSNDRDDNDDDDTTIAPIAAESVDATASATTAQSDNQNLAGGKDADNSLDANAINEQLETIRVVREAVAAAAAKDRQEINQQEEQGVSNLESDQHPAESQPAVDDLSLDNEADDENRNKRFLPFGFGSSSGSSSGGSAGSGNFLFDIIRLFAGSMGTQSQDERANAPDGTENGDGYTEGIPGPVTRLFVLGNRGLSNLIQDLILRIARTSERLVNFKARLITSLI